MDEGSAHREALYLSGNPFCVMRLAAGATNEEIQARYAEARVFSRLSNDAGGQNLDNLRSAQTSLLNSRTRYLNESAWFYDPPDGIFDGNITNPEETLNSFEQSALLPGDQGIRYKHDLANWLLLLATTSVHVLNTSVENKLNEYSIKALHAWSDLLDDPDYINLVTDDANNWGESITMIWNSVVIPPISLAMANAVSAGNISMAIGYVEALYDTACSGEEIGTACADSFKCLIERLKVIQGQVETIEEHEAISESSLLSRTQPILDKALELKSFLTIAVNGDIELDARIAEANTAIDNAVIFVRGLILDWANCAGGFNPAIALRELRKMREIITVSAESQRLVDDDIRYVSYLVNMGRLPKAVESQNWSEVLRLAEASLSLTSDEELRRQLQAVISRAQFEINSPRKNMWDGYQVPWKLIGWGVVIMFVAVCGYISSGGDTGSGYQSTSAPAAPVRSQPAYESAYPSTNKRNLGSVIDANEAQLKQIKAEHDNLVDRFDSICPVLDCELPDHLYNQATVLDAQITAKQNEYNGLLRETQRLIDEYNSSY